jgi:anti-sigma factor RsiW
VSECEQELLIQAEFDDELDAAQLVAAQRHRRGCARCTQVYEELQQISQRLRATPRFDAPGSLRANLSKQLTHTPPPSWPTHRTRTTHGRHSRWPHVLVGAVSGAAVAALAMFMILPSRPSTSELLVDSHVRALQSPSHLLDIVSTEHHVVRPWFAGQLPFAPPVKDLALLGYPLQGARIDVIGGQPVAVLVYRAGRHSVDLFVWPDSRQSPVEPRAARGFNLKRWSANGMSVWAVTDLNSHELDAFADHWQTSP